MMALDPENNLDTWPLVGIDKFIDKCNERGVKDVFVTGTNTDPLLFKHTRKLAFEIKNRIIGSRLGIRTNAVALHDYNQLLPYTNGSVTICSFDPYIYKKMMGQGEPPDLAKLVQMTNDAGWREPFKVNIVLGPENCGGRTLLTSRVSADIVNSITECIDKGIKRINLREPYGQPTVGNPLEIFEDRMVEQVHGMSTYDFYGTYVTYWDVHYCEVESVNLYANGKVSEDYPITRGHSDETGKVLDQSNFSHGRHNEQWIKLRKK